MPRRRRVHLPDIPLHIVQRGHNRDACFFTDEDRGRYMSDLAHALAESGCRLHAYVLMTNHVHLLLTPLTTDAVPRLMMSLGRRYVQYVNKRYRRSGTLWESRYKCSTVQTDRYLLLCQRYVELNPVRAAMVSDPAEYRWSSYRANGLGADDDVVTPHDTYLELGRDRDERLEAYRSLFESQIDARLIDDIQVALEKGGVVGEGRFRETIERVTGVSCEVRPRGRPKRN